MAIESLKKKATVILIVALFAIGFLTLAFRYPTGMEGVRVAVYNDRGAIASSSTALLNMFRWM
ncbi:MAG: hypothetical protein ACFFAY_01460, partial [Promethearchaeota archaeon]